MFNMPAQPLEQALVKFGNVANIQIAYDANLLHGQRSTALIGPFHVREALELMLRGTGLYVRYTNNTGVTLAAEAAASDQVLQMEDMRIRGAPVEMDRGRFIAFARQLETRIIGDLTQRSGTTHYAFDLTVRLSLQKDGHVDQVKVVSSSVAPGQTQTIVDILKGLGDLPPPPPGLPQPLQFRFYSRVGF